MVEVLIFLLLNVVCVWVVGLVEGVMVVRLGGVLFLWNML